MWLGLGTWRAAAVEGLELKPGHSILDLATAFAELPLEMVRREPQIQVVGLDPSRQKLAIAENEIERAGAEGLIQLVPGNAERLPFASESFDGVSMAFGMHGVSDQGQALREMHRVLRPGGRLVLVEMSGLGRCRPFEGLVTLMKSAGLEVVQTRPLSFGVGGLSVAQKRWGEF